VKRHIRLGRPWIWIPVAVVILAVSGFAVQRSVTVRTSWRVLPYQTLRLSDSGDGGTVTFKVPTPTSLDVARGYIETQHAVRLHVVSNTPWRIQAQIRNSDDIPAGLQLRNSSGVYVTLSDQPQIVAEGLNGVFEIGIDYRLQISSGDPFTPISPCEIIYTIMSD
jgi:hypothetical protein